MEIKEMVREFNIRLHEDGQHLKADMKKVGNNVALLKENKQAIMVYLKKEEARKEAEKAAEEAEREAAYMELEKKLPERKIENTPDEDKFGIAMSKVMDKHYSDPEDSGLEMAVEANNEKAYKQAQEFCSHELHTEISRTYTADARYKVVRTISCPKCGLVVVDSVEEPVSEEWR